MIKIAANQGLRFEQGFIDGRLMAGILFVPNQVKNALSQVKIETLSDLMLGLRNRQQEIAQSLGWTVSDVESARIKFEKNMGGYGVYLK